LPAPLRGAGSCRRLLYVAEDAYPIVRRRLESIAAAAGVDLRNLDIQVITAPTLRLALPADRLALQDAVARLQPRFLRLHRIDANASGEVAPLLAYLRELQRQHSLAVLVVHHAKKDAGNVRAGQALRGSSEFHAWGDSNLYLRREGDTLTLTVEHRAAPALKPMKIKLIEAGEALALELVERSETAAPVPSSLDERITAALAAAASPIPFAELRSHCRVRNATPYEGLAALTASRRIVNTADAGYRLAR
jgi:hypothetical protein